jgi:hypothetical protein
LIFIGDPFSTVAPIQLPLRGTSFPPGKSETVIPGGGHAFLGNETTPDYTGTQPFSTNRAKWSCRATHHVGDQPVGQKSAR